LSTATIKIGPADHGQRMSLADFEYAEVEEGHLYELGRGVIVVSDVPNPPHVAQVIAIRDQLSAYKFTHPGKIYGILSGNECKIPTQGYESERHPDLAVYTTQPPSAAGDVWATWIPDLVIEVVSPGSEHRDYTEKREEYLVFGVREYWIFDGQRQEMLVLQRSAGRWVERVVRPADVYRTHLFPGMEFTCAPVFEAARVVGG
jgi:Uma2 family endonuclease